LNGPTVHNGVCFPPEYVPHNVKMKYNGLEIKLTPEAEEIGKVDEFYGYRYLDGCKEKVGNFRIEPPDALIPPPPAGHSWGAANSSFKGQNRLSPVCQCATAMYFIDRLVLRAGNEKTGEEVDTIGCCSLRCERITLVAPKTVKFDFLAKDSIRYVNSAEYFIPFGPRKRNKTSTKKRELKNEWKSGKINPKKGQTSEKLWSQIENLAECIETTKLLKNDKEDNTATAL
ncbi:1838_t:CDS:2, partial [Entrophospora sp. SA101]